MNKRSLIISLVITVFVITSLGVKGQDVGSVWKFIDQNQPLVIAHRGASSLAPENTLASVKKALQLGVDVVEIDVHRTKDRELVVIHDSTIDRTTPGSGAVRNYTLPALNDFDAGGWFDASFAGERIPTLRAVLETTKDKAILLIELKSNRAEVPTINLVKELGMTDQVIIQSFKFEHIKKVNEKAPEIPTVLLVSEPKHSSNPQKAATWITNTAEYSNATGIGIRHNWLTPELIELAMRKDLAIFVWTVDKSADLQKFIETGVQGIITNRPQDLQKLLSNPSN